MAFEKYSNKKIIRINRFKIIGIKLYLDDYLSIPKCIRIMPYSAYKYTGKACKM